MIGWVATTPNRRNSISSFSVGGGPVVLSPRPPAAARYFLTVSRANPVARAIARWLSLTCQRRTTSSISIRRSSRYLIPSTLFLVADMVANGTLGWPKARWRSAGLKLDGDLPVYWTIPRGDPHLQRPRAQAPVRSTSK